jgi:hypothetical protein
MVEEIQFMVELTNDGLRVKSCQPYHSEKMHYRKCRNMVITVFKLPFYLLQFSSL